MLACPSLYLRHFTRRLHLCGVLQYKRTTVIQKRAKMLMKLIQNRDKKKHWDMQIGSPTGAPDGNIYSKIHRPHKRATVLNSLFMKNICDVMSTGDSCPELIGYGVEITGVNITSDYQIVNVYWQIPDVEDTCNTNVEMLLRKTAPQIRSELIKRNVLGKVPFIAFIRDPTNKRAADFQKCLQAAKVNEIEGRPTVSAEELLEDVYKFPDIRDIIPDDDVKEEETPKEKVEVTTSSYEAPLDMKTDLMGISHKKLLNQIFLGKKNLKRTPQGSQLLSDDLAEDRVESKSGDVVHSIPASPLLSDADDREKQLKQFYLDRKIKADKMNEFGKVEAGFCDITKESDDDDVVIDDRVDEDYLEEEEDQGTNERST